MDRDVLHICSRSKENYDRFRKYIKPHTVNKEVNTLLELMGEYWKHYPKANFNWEAFFSFSTSELEKRLSADGIVMVRTMVKSMDGFEGTETQEVLIKSLIEKDYCARIMEECSKLRDGTSDLEHVQELATDALKAVERFIDKDELFVTPDISGMVERLGTTGYEWRLNALNRSLSTLRPGNFVIVAARVETGKTTFLASEVSFLAPQLPKDRPVVWVNNEEESETVFFRVVQAAIGWTTEDIKVKHKEAMALYEKVIGDPKRIMITNGETNDVKSLDALFKLVNPGLIVFDQLDKVHGFKSDDREDMRLGQLYKWAREKAREYGPVIAASQISAEAELLKDPPFIGMESLRGSKTDKAGEADAIITIGKWKEPAPGEEFLRTLNVPKNKLIGGGSRKIEEERHGKYTVRICPLIARYEDH